MAKDSRESRLSVSPLVCAPAIYNDVVGIFASFDKFPGIFVNTELTSLVSFHIYPKSPLKTFQTDQIGSKLYLSIKNASRKMKQVRVYKER